MALRDAVKSGVGARRFAEGLFAWIHGPGKEEAKFEQWIKVVGALRDGRRAC